MDWFEFWLNTLTLAAQGILQLFFMSRAAGKALRKTYLVIYPACLYLASSVCAPLAFDYGAVPLNIAAAYGISRAGLKNSRPAACVAAVLSVYVTQISNGFVNSLTVLIYPLVIRHLFLIDMIVIVSTLLSLGLCYGCFRLILTCFSLQWGENVNSVRLLLPPCFFLFAAELYILSANYPNVATYPAPIEVGKHLALSMLQALGLAALFSSLYAYRRVCDGFRAQTALASLAWEARAQKVYVAEARARYENAGSFRHDIKNHLCVLGGLLKSGAIDQAQDYLQKLDAATGELSFLFATANPVVDILLENKQALCTKHKIRLDVSLTLPADCALTDLDWCVIFANALDNSIHACMQADGSKVILITGERQGDFYMLEFENSCLENQPSVPDFGIGLNNIKNVAEKYGGSMTAERKGKRFFLGILLNISRQKA